MLGTKISGGMQLLVSVSDTKQSSFQHQNQYHLLLCQLNAHSRLSAGTEHLSTPPHHHHHVEAGEQTPEGEL